MHPILVERSFHERATRHLGWGVVLLAAAAAFWIYAAWQVFTPHTLESSDHECSAPAFSERAGLYDPNFEDLTAERRCAGARDWPGPVSALVVSTPLATVGGMLFTSGTMIRRIRAEDETLRRARDEEARRTNS
ncbi:MAG: hypothetical protein ACRDP3_17045 [Streptomyces sp.]|uniref:hypothetical protein n=1 Tax=Streptomyces sp. TaxID=1931 RepID=UPI003D6A663C